MVFTTSPAVLLAPNSPTPIMIVFMFLILQAVLKMTPRFHPMESNFQCTHAYTEKMYLFRRITVDYGILVSGPKAGHFVSPYDRIAEGSSHLFTVKPQFPDGFFRFIPLPVFDEFQ